MQTVKKQIRNRAYVFFILNLLSCIVSLLNPSAKIGSRIVPKTQEFENYGASMPNSLQKKQFGQKKTKSAGIVQLSDDEVCF